MTKNFKNLIKTNQNKKYVVFYVKSIILKEWFPESAIENVHYYNAFLTKLKVRNKMTRTMKNDFILHQNNLPAHT